MLKHINSAALPIAAAKSLVHACFSVTRLEERESRVRSSLSPLIPLVLLCGPSFLGSFLTSSVSPCVRSSGGSFFTSLVAHYSVGSLRSQSYPPRSASLCPLVLVLHSLRSFRTKPRVHSVGTAWSLVLGAKLPRGLRPCSFHFLF